MKPGAVVLFRFPQTDLSGGKLRPALWLGALPGRHGDALLCMISTRLHHEVPGFDEVLAPDADDYSHSGLKAPSLIRVGRIAVADPAVIEGVIGSIAPERFARIVSNLQSWLEGLKNA